jgi:CRISPR/Cas system-associated endonuclease Cas1
MWRGDVRLTTRDDAENGQREADGAGAHEGSDGSSKFIFDLMKPERPKVDRAALDFVKGHVFDPADFVIRSDGVCRLNLEMARMTVARVST